MWRRALPVFWLIGVALGGFPGATAADSSVRVRAVGSVVFTVSDMDRAMDFYGRVLTFEKVSDSETAGNDVERFFGVFGSRVRVVRMKLGDESIELVQFLAPTGRAIPADSHSNDVWFQHIAVIVSDMDRAYAILRSNKVDFASSEPQRLPDWNKNAAGIKAFYFKDPDKHPVEILQFPDGKGDSKWHQNGGRIFLGIDHTAIVVSNTDSSLKFYRDLLGLHIVGESDNYGTEQEHLNNVFGAHLRIISLRAEAGPGIELLEYLSPRDGRTIPVDERANDVVHHETELETSDAEAELARLRAAGAPFISSGDVAFHDGALSVARGFVVRDPDGHAVGIVQK